MRVLFVTAVGLLMLFPSARADYILRSIVNNGDGNFNQELEIDNAGVIAGHFGDGMVVRNNGYTVVSPFGQANFIAETSPNGSDGAVATDESNSGVISRFLTVDGNTYGFLDNGLIAPYLSPESTFTQFLGLNNQGLVAGDDVDAMGNTHGLVFKSVINSWQTVDDPIAVSGTDNGATISGLNDKGEIVRSYVNAASQTIGLLSTATPEPTSLAIVGLGAILVALGYKKRRP